MKRELAAIYDELLRRQKTGEKAVFLSEDSLDFLRREAVSEPVIMETRDSTPVVRRPAKKVAAINDIPTPPELQIPDGTPGERLNWLRERVESDRWCCSQVKKGKRVVLGVGSPQAKIFFCGEAPGAEEEVQGEPFVGPAGDILTRMIQAMGLTREEVYIGNIMNYRPPMPGPIGNRPPTLDEMRYCLPFLKAQLEIVQPEVIVALGRTALDGLMGPDSKRRMSSIRGQWMEFDSIPLMPTFHPSYLLRNKSLATRRQVWEDILKVMDKLSVEVSQKQRDYFKQ